MSEIAIADVELTIVGNQDAKVAIATIGDWSAIGVSKRDPEDKPNEAIGEALAAGRAIRQLGRKILSDTNKEIRQEAYAAQQQKIAQARTKVEKAWAEYYFANPVVTVIDGPPAPPSDQLVTVKPVDPEIERLLAEEEEIERKVKAAHETPKGQDDDLPVQGFANIHEFFAFIDSLGEIKEIDLDED